MYNNLPLIITCAITGGHSKDENPNLPVTLEEQLLQSCDAAAAGASMIHIHRRSAKNVNVMTEVPNEYYELNVAIRAKCPDVIINNTSGGSKVRSSSGEMLPPSTVSISATPEVASIDAYNLVDKRLASPMEGRDTDSLLTPEESKEVLAKMRKHGCKPEYMCYGIDDFRYMKEFVNQGLLEEMGEKGPHWVQLCCTEKTIHANIDCVSEAIRTLPKNCLFGGIAGGDTQWGILPTVIALGGHIRIGMEDNLFIKEGEKAVSNAQLVEKIVRIAKEMGREVATPAQAREILKIDASPRQYENKTI